MIRKIIFRRFFKICSYNKTHGTILLRRNFSGFNSGHYGTPCIPQNSNISERILRSIHSTNHLEAKAFVETENKYVFSIIQRVLPLDFVFVCNSKVNTSEDFNSTLNRNWRSSSASDILKAFKNVKEYCFHNNINLSDTRFDQLVDGLVDHCEDLTDKELLELLLCLSEFPSCDSFTSHNFHDVWSCLDDICCWKMHNWDTNTLFVFASVWYKLNLGKVSDYTFELLDRLTKRADRLSKDQLVHIFFCFNICRRRPVDFEYEFALQHNISQMNVNEMAVVALGYFKTKSKIKLNSILEPMIKAVTANSKTIHEMSLTAILKEIRFSKPLKLVVEVNEMLDKLYFEIGRLSELCCLHISLMGTGLLSFHQNTLQKTSERLAKHLKNTDKVRLKDIERILNVLSMFNYNPKTDPDIFQTAFEELHKKERLEEMIKYPRCLNCALHYLSLRNVYSYELMDKILDIEHITDNYGRQSKTLPYELLSLNSSIDIECPDYSGNRLPLKLKYKATKWRLEWVPSYDQYKKISATDQLILDTIATVKRIVKSDDLMFIDHVLPHFSRADIILCKQKSTGDFVKPIGFENYVLGDVMFPFNDDTLEWYAIMILGWNNTIRDTSLPLGSLVMKERQLRKIGYKPVMVIWNEFLKLTQNEKIDYILRKLV